MIATCPPNEDLRALSLGRLSEEGSDEIVHHIRDCQGCQDRLAEIDAHPDGEDTLIAQLREDTDSDSFGRETGCQLATAKALGSLAIAQTEDENALAELLPEVIGEYEVIRPIGRGGMGSVYLARHTKLNRDVAIKVLSSRRLAEPAMRERFAAEMRMVGGLCHPNIVTAHDAREVDGLAVLVTEFIEGLDVGQIVRRLGPLPVADACAIGACVAHALYYISDQNLVHRDVKPSNVMINQDGEVKLLDLGLARLQEPTADEGEITGTGQAMGTADYIAPEQVNDSRTVDSLADVYSLGCSLFKLLSGRAPFDNEQHATAFAKLNAHVSTAPPSLTEVAPHVPRAVAELVDGMLQKDASHRPQSLERIASQLEEQAVDADLIELVAAASKACEDVPTKRRIQDDVRISRNGPFLRRRAAVLTALGCLMVGAAFGYYAGIVVTIKKPDGTETSIEAPDGSHIAVDDDGNARVTLPRSASPEVASTQASPVSTELATYSGKTQSQWLEELNAERKPENLLEAMEALAYLVNEDSESADEVARAIFRLMRRYGSNLDGTDSNAKLIRMSCVALTRMPPHVSVSAMLSEIDNGNHYSRKFMIHLLHQHFSDDLAQQKLFAEMKKRANEFSDASLRLSRRESAMTREWAIRFLINFCNILRIDPSQVDGLVQALKDAVSTEKGELSLMIAAVLLQVDPHTDGLAESLAPLVVNPSRPSDQSNAIRFLSELGPLASPAVPSLVSLLQKRWDSYRRTHTEKSNLVRLIKALGDIGPAAEEALSILEEIRQHSLDLREAASMAIEKISGAGPLTSSRAAKQIRRLRLLMDQYRIDVGTYPSTQQGLSALKTAPSDLSDPTKWGGPYTKTEIAPDPWGKPYQYQLIGPDKFRIWSFGPDMQDDTGDEVGSEP